MIELTINDRIVDALAIVREWPGVAVACFPKRISNSTLVEWDETGPVPVKTEAEIKTAQNNYEKWLADLDAQVDDEMDAHIDNPITLSILEAIAEKLPGPVSVDELRTLAKTKARINARR